jgi:hypothetical protein
MKIVKADSIEDLEALPTGTPIILYPSQMAIGLLLDFIPNKLKKMSGVTSGGTIRFIDITYSLFGINIPYRTYLHSNHNYRLLSTLILSELPENWNKDKVNEGFELVEKYLKKTYKDPNHPKYLEFIKTKTKLMNNEL